MENIGTEVDSGVKTEGQEEAKCSAEEDAETLSGVRGADQSVGYIVCFVNVIKLYQRKNQNCLDVVVLTTSWETAQRISASLPKQWV